MSSPMHRLAQLPGRRRLGIYWAGARFERPGLWVWTGRDNVRVLPWPRRLLRRWP